MRLRSRNNVLARVALIAIACGGAFAFTTADTQYVAQQTGGIVQLRDASTQTDVSILPSVGNIAFQLKVKGHDVLRWPYGSVDEFRQK
ncbi:MAG TPA: hypothetical protein VF456_05360, partial [Vicinamibacterales bacterium]